MKIDPLEDGEFSLLNGKWDSFTTLLDVLFAVNMDKGESDFSFAITCIIKAIQGFTPEDIVMSQPWLTPFC